MPAKEEAANIDGAAEGISQLVAKAQQEGGLGVIVVLDAPGVEISGDESVEATGMEVVAQAQEDVMAALVGQDVKNVYRYKYFPFMSMRVDAAALQTLASNPRVVSVEEDTRNSLLLADSTPLIGATEVWDLGYDGTGETVAILDTGVDKTHPFLAGKVVREGCFSAAGGYPGASGLCPKGDGDKSEGSGVNCSVENNPDCLHGTHVAGIAAGRDYPGGPGFSGVAKGANIISVQVFTEWNGDIYVWDSDFFRGLEYIYSLSRSYNISSVNVSFGGGRYRGNCDSSQFAEKWAIDRLRKVNIATIVASGNGGYTNSITSPACISTAISVGSTDKSNKVSSYSNSAPMLDLLAPGENINSSIPNGGYDVLSGTSMAAPHVTGAWAAYRQFNPTATVDDVLSALQSTGLKIKDWRGGGYKQRIDLAYLFGSVISQNSTAPSLIFPEEGANLVNSTPVYQWTHVPLAYSYQLTVQRGTLIVLNKTYMAAQICNRTDKICHVDSSDLLKTGTYTWSVKLNFLKGTGLSSETHTFTTPLTVPTVVTQTSPTGSYFFIPPGFTWEPGTVQGDQYKLEIWRNGIRIFSKTYEATQICNPSTCELAHPVPMLAGNYTWTVTPWNRIGFGPTATLAFTQTYSGFDSQFNGDHEHWTVRYSEPDWIQTTNLFLTRYGDPYTWSSISYDALYSGTLDYAVNLEREWNNDGDEFPNGIIIQGNPTLKGPAKSWTSGYAFLYTPIGCYSVWKISNGKWGYLSPWHCNQDYVSYESNTLRVVYNYGNIYYYTNGHLVWKGRNTSFRNGMVGILSLRNGTYYNLRDRLLVDWATLNTSLSSAALGTLDMQEKFGEAKVIIPSPLDGSPAGPNISMAEYESLMARQPQSLTPEQTQSHLQVCLEKGYDFYQEKPAQ